MPLVPSKRLCVLAFGMAAVALMARMVPTLRPLVWGLDAVLVVLVLVDALTLRRVSVAASRDVASVWSVGRPNPVRVEVRNLGVRTVTGLVDDDPIPRARREDIPAPFSVGPLGTVSLRYVVTPLERGPRTFGALTVRMRGPLGLVFRQIRATQPSKVDVYPDVHAARALELLRRSGREDPRLGSLRVRGGNTEFERLRPYAEGDEVRHIDWRATARRDEAVVREYRTESNQNIVFAIDMGRGMRGEHGGLSRLDHALNAALLTADVAVRAGDNAGLLAFDDAPRVYLNPARGRMATRRFVHATHALSAGLSASDYRGAMALLARRLHARSLIVFFTDFLDSRAAAAFSASLSLLSPRHLALCVLLRDMDVAALVRAPFHTERELFERAAAAEMLARRAGIVASLRARGTLVLDAVPDQATAATMAQYLAIKGRGAL